MNLRERGAALITSLILLAVMTILAVSTMSTSSLELTMAGNAQFKENAFQAAETGVEAGLREYSRGPGTVYPLLTDEDPPQALPSPDPDVTVTVSGTRTGPGCPYATQDVDSPFTAYYMQLEAVAEGDRNARSTHQVGLVVCQQ